MSTIRQDITHIHALRKHIRDPKVPAAILKSIENIQVLLSKSQQGWKKVEWRTPAADTHHSAAFGHRGKHATHHGSAAANAGPKEAVIDNRPSPHKYVSKFKKSSENVDDTILYTILRGKLNKFSQSNYAEIKEFITHIIDGGQTDMMKCFMKLVFEKAASEEIFCPLYAKLLSELSLQYPVLLSEMANLYTQYMDIFDEVQDVPAGESYNDICKRHTEKKYRRGYSQFLAELIKHNVIDIDTFIKIITKILSQVERHVENPESVKLIEEFADCLMKIIKAIQSYRKDATDASQATHIIHRIKAILKSEFEVRIKPLSVRQPEKIGLSNKARFTFLDLYEAVQRFQ